MAIHPDSNALLKAIPLVLEGVAVDVVNSDGIRSLSFGSKHAGAEEHRFEVPDGELVASLSPADPSCTLVRSLLTTIAERERLESDMESMNGSALRLLEQVSMMGEALPRLSAAGGEAEIAALGARACHRAAGVERVVYVSGDPHKDFCEVIVHDTGPNVRRMLGADQEVASIQRVTGLLEEVLSADGVIIRAVPEGEQLGERGSVESLAKRQVLGVPVTYGSGEKRIILGALLLIDRATTLADELESFDPSLGNEEGQIADSFAAMLGAVLGARKVAELGKELAMAQTIQQQILPDGPVMLDGFDVAADYSACGAVGGDYYDYLQLADGRTMVVVADVSGHNLASGMIMVGARATLRTMALVHEAPEQVFSRVGELMYQDLMQTERFLTAAAIALSPNGRSIDYVSAGHNDLMIYRTATDSVDRIGSEDVILGFLPKPEYAARRLLLQPGDCILLYTDGIPEAVDSCGVMFGEDRLSLLFAQLATNQTAQRILDGIMKELDVFRHGQMVADDVTAVVIRYTGEEVIR